MTTIDGAAYHPYACECAKCLGLGSIYASEPREITDEMKAMAKDAARYRRLRENWIDCEELGLHGRLAAIDAEIDRRLIETGKDV